MIAVIYDKESKNKIRAFYKKFLRVVEIFINKLEKDHGLLAEELN
jgi:hypothetical protein